MPPYVIAHRGASSDAPENTLPAFERAIAAGADYVELDVQASVDGALVVFHDLDLERLTGSKGPLRRRTLTELRALDVRRERIPTLDEVLELAAGRIGVMLELKSAYLYRRHDIVRRSVEALRRRLEPEQVAVLSFEPRALRETRALAPELRTVQHVGFGRPLRSARGAWAAGFESSRATPRALARARELGLATTVYTVNDEDRMRELALLEVSGIFSDRPALLRRVVNDLAG